MSSNGPVRRIMAPVIAVAAVTALLVLVALSLPKPTPTDPHITACVAWVKAEHPENTTPGKTCKVMRERNPHEFPELFK